MGFTVTRTVVGCQPNERVAAVTGALSYTGKHIARRLLALGWRVRTLTGHPKRPNPFDGRLAIAPLDFSRPEELVSNLRGVRTLYNTYWIRFPHGGRTFEQAVENSQVLFRAACEAGVRRIVHVSIANPSADSTLCYYRGKAAVETLLKESRLAYAILRPTVVFGDEGVLINNIAWLLAKFPFFAIPGKGEYRLQPIFVEDLAELAVRAGEEVQNLIMDAVGPDVFSFDELLRLIASAIGSRSRIIHVPPRLALWFARAVGALSGDILLTAEEVEGLMRNLLVSAQGPTGRTRLGDWLLRNAHRVGGTYFSELDRHFR